MQNQALRRGNAQSGNALWYILIAIALLAALSYALMRNSSKMASNLGDDQAAIIAAQIQRDFNTTAQAVQKLMTVNGCSATDLSFESSAPNGASYVNPTAPTDKHCHVFDPAGAGLTSNVAPNGVFAAPAYWSYTGNIAVSGVGPEYATQTTCTSDCAELIVMGQGIDEKVCSEYNKMLKLNGGVAPVETDNVGPTYFTGTYGPGLSGSNLISVGNGSSTTTLYNVKTGCYLVGTTYQIYYVLLTR